MYRTVQAELSAGDLDAARLGFAQLLRRKRFSARFIGANAEDLLARARFEYTRALAEGAEIHSPPGWIIHCAWRRTQNLLEAESNRPTFVSTEKAGAIEDTATPTPEEAAISEERARRIEEAMSRLSPDQRTLIELSYFEGMSVREAGRFLNWHASKAQRCHEAALRRLRELLAVEDIDALGIEIGLAAWISVATGKTIAVSVPAGVEAVADAGGRAAGGLWSRTHELARRLVLGGASEPSGAMAAGNAARAAGVCGAAAVACLAGGVVGPGVGGVGLLPGGGAKHQRPAAERAAQAAPSSERAAVRSDAGVPPETTTAGKFAAAGGSGAQKQPGAAGEMGAKASSPGRQPEAEFSPFAGAATGGSEPAASDAPPVARSAAEGSGGGGGSAPGGGTANKEFGAFR